MKRDTQNDSRLKKRATILLAAAATLTALVFTSPVQAGGHGNHERYVPYKQYKHYDYGHARVHRGHRVMPPAFAAPVRMINRYRVEYRPFFVGTVWSGPHRHRHEIYVFPVRTRHGIVYRQYEYCRGELFVGYHDVGGHIAYHGKNVSFSIGF